MTDNGSPADANAADASAEQFPLRLRVHALARTLGLTSRQVLAHLEELGVAARTAQSSINRDDAEKVASLVRGDAPAAEAAPAESAPELAAAPVTESLFSAIQVEQPATAPASDAVAPLFLPPTAPEPVAKKEERPESSSPAVDAERPAPDAPEADTSSDDDWAATATTADTENDSDNGEEGKGNRRRRRGRRGRGRGRGDAAEQGDDAAQTDGEQSDAKADEAANADGDETDGDEQVADVSAEQDTAEQSDSAQGDSAQGDSGDAPKDGAAKEGTGRGRSRRRRSRGSNADTTGDQNADEKNADEKNSGDKNAGGKNAEAKGPEGKGSEGGKDGDSNDGGDAKDDADDEAGDATPTSKRRRRRRRRKGGEAGDEGSPDDPPNTVVHEREPRAKRVRDEVQGISGSTRLEAKRQRRRDGRDAGRRRPPILSESEFLARRESVERVMVVRERDAQSVIREHGHAPTEDYTQVAVLEDGVLVEHFVTTETSQSMVGNIYLGRVQNVLPGMEAAFVDIGRGRNGVLYAGEVNWEAAGLDGGSRKIEQALKPGDYVLVQVSKDPVGHKGARLTTQISLAGRYLVYVPGGTSTGISRKLPDTERKRLKSILSKLVPDEAGVIIRTASEGVSAEELGADIERLETQWKGIEAAAAEHTAKASGNPRALYEEPDLLVRVVRDLFNEDFKKLVVEGDKAWNLVSGYVGGVAPDLMERVERFESTGPDSFAVYRIDEQLAKALDRKVWLPSGGTLIIEHTEAMTVVDVNTGKFTGSGGNLEETVTRNNLEAAEEIVRQMRLRDIGGMIIVDFIDMVLESNRDLVLRRLTEALGRDRTRHQVSEVTSLGLVQMTRKRLGTGLLEAFSTTCTTCHGRGVIVHANPVEVRPAEDARASEGGGSKRSRRNKRKSEQAAVPAAEAPKPVSAPHKPAAEHPLFKAMAHHDEDDVEGVETREIDVVDQIVAEAVAAVVAEDGVVDVVTVTETVSVMGTVTESARSAPEPVVLEPVDLEPVAVEPEAAAVPAEPAEPAAPVVKRRRRAARRASAPTTPAEPLVVTTDQPPVTFVAAQAAEPVVEVKRTPRRRAGRRTAGPPPGAQE
ncbi:MAG: translation initiation factor IF-2 N-terminal domain-containing protein [Gordonia sp. (in: high G+C Gram-positive bacteria)]